LYQQKEVTETSDLFGIMESASAELIRTTGWFETATEETIQTFVEIGKAGTESINPFGFARLVQAETFRTIGLVESFLQESCYTFLKLF